jgi:iron(III) transport system substrate-binding protein
MRLHNIPITPAGALGALIIGAFVTSAAPGAQAASVAEVVNYKGSDRTAKLEAGAKKEGNLILYATGTQIRPLIEHFGKKYPYIRTRLDRANSTKTLRKVLEEYKAGAHIGDGLELTAGALGVMRNSKILIKYYSPELASFDKAAIGPGGFWVGVRESYGGMAYNSKIIKAADAPKTWDDLLDPKFKGKMAISDSPTTKGNWAGVLLLTKGKDWFRKLANQNITRFKMSSRALANLNAAGEVIISARASNAHIANSRRKGASLVFVEPGPMAVSDTGVAVLKNAPHPHAMMLMVDFLTSEEGQKMYVKIGYASARKGIKSAISPKQKMYLANRPNYVNEFEGWLTMFDSTVKRVSSKKAPKRKKKKKK